MSTGDRLFRALFVAAAVGLGWGIRGDFGHMLGAMFPGAALGLAFAYVTGQRSMFRWMPLVGAAGGLGISLGGMMSYGILHGYAKSDTFINYSYGYLCLVLQGGAWGGFGGAAIGLVLERNRLRPVEWFSLLSTVLACGWAVYHVVVTLLGFHINPPRSDLSIGFTGGIIGLLVWLRLHDRSDAFRGTFFGYLGFALGMSVGRFLGNLMTVLPDSMSINNWNIMEISCGFIGGLIFTFGMLGQNRRFPDPPAESPWPLIGKLGALYVLAGIPLYHRLRRIDPEQKLASYAKMAESLDVADPQALADTIMTSIHVVCLLGFVATGVWLYLLAHDRYRLSALPVLMLSGIMLLIQNLNAMYFWREHGAGYINTQTGFWALLVFMIVFAIFYPVRKSGAETEAGTTGPDDTRGRFDWKKWVAAGLGVYLLTILLAGIVNGEKTMSSANTRWPLWSWRDGTFPGR